MSRGKKNKTAMNPKGTPRNRNARMLRIIREDLEEAHLPENAKTARMMPQEWMDRSELAVWLGVCVRTVDNWASDGTLPCYKHGGVLRFNREECRTAMRAFRRRARGETDKS